MLPRLNRRELLVSSTLTAAGATCLPMAGGRSFAADEGEKPIYTFPVLGDLHYDLMVHHDLDWVRREKPHDLRQIEGYVRASTLFTPRLLSEVAALTAAQESPVPFAVQVGDFGEGLCGSQSLQALQFRDAIRCVRDSGLNVPLLVTKGNHDITGPGAEQAYDDVLVPWMSEQIGGGAISRAAFHLRHDEDLFVFFDAYKPDLDWLEATLRQNPARHAFFVVHPPVVPYDARSNWIIFSRDDRAGDRQRLLGLLGEYEAIVLSGHLHKYSLATRRTNRGSFAQLAILSILRDEQTKLRQVLRGVEHFGADLVNLEPQFNPPTLAQRRRILSNERPLIDHFEHANVPGYAMVHVYAKRVDAEIYVGLGQNRWKTDQLSRPMA